jgi:hypothetical protein
MCGAMEADPTDPFEQPYWTLDQFLIWLVSRDPAAVLKATDRPWRAYQESNVDRQKVEKVEIEAVRAIKGAASRASVKGRGPLPLVEFGESFMPDDPGECADYGIEFEGKPTFAALLMRTTNGYTWIRGYNAGPTIGTREKVRPQFKPQSIRRLYPALTPSNIFDRPDVENPDAGPFIAYFDALTGLAKRISLRESLPIDEACTRAEKDIRRICINSPEKLTMLGFHKDDRDAELKPIIPRAWQGLSIDPLHGQPEADLEAIGYRREYGAATKGKYGPVIWTGLCFDRKRFVAAFVTGGGNGPPTHTAHDERAATSALASLLRKQPGLTIKNARQYCDHFGQFGRVRFKRIWQNARDSAGLSVKAPPGRPPKSGR